MSLVPNDPFRQLANVRKEFDQLFSDFPAVFHHGQQMGGMRVDVHESENEIVAVCDLPGLESKDDVQIDIEKNMLHISGTINKSTETKSEHMHQQERYIGRFQRSISLPSPVDQEGVSATYKNGVLEVKMPKITTDDRKQIDIEFH